MERDDGSATALPGEVLAGLDYARSRDGATSARCLLGDLVHAVKLVRGTKDATLRRLL